MCSRDFGSIDNLKQLKECLDEFDEKDLESFKILYVCPLGKTKGVYLTYSNGYLIINKSEQEAFK